MRAAEFPRPVTRREDWPDSGTWWQVIVAALRPPEDPDAIAARRRIAAVSLTHGDCEALGAVYDLIAERDEWKARAEAAEASARVIAEAASRERARATRAEAALYVIEVTARTRGYGAAE